MIRLLFLLGLSAALCMVLAHSSSSSSKSSSGGDSNGYPDSSEPRLLQCPLKWDYKCVLPLTSIHPKTGSPEDACELLNGYVVDGVCHIDPGPFIEANECCRFG